MSHVIKVEERMWKLDVLMELQLEPFIINVSSSDDDDAEFLENLPTYQSHYNRKKVMQLHY